MEGEVETECQTLYGGQQGKPWQAGNRKQSRQVHKTSVRDPEKLYRLLRKAARVDILSIDDEVDERQGPFDDEVRAMACWSAPRTSYVIPRR